MKIRKMPEEIADIIDKMYGDKPIGTELYDVLTDSIKSAGYVDAEVEEIRREVIPLLKEARSIRLRIAS